LNLFFKDLMYDRQATATLTYTYYGGADLGECLTTTRQIQEGGAEGWYREGSLLPIGFSIWPKRALPRGTG
jgi:hypothetical protein